MPGGALPRRYPEKSCLKWTPLHRHQRAGTHRGALRGSGAGGKRLIGPVPLSRPHAARSVDAAPLRLHQDRRGLRPSLHLLRDPAIPRASSAAAVSSRVICRSHAPVRAGRPRDQPDRPGHHLLRRRLRHQGRPGARCWRGWRRSAFTKSIADSASEKWIYASSTITIEPFGLFCEHVFDVRVARNRSGWIVRVGNVEHSCVGSRGEHRSYIVRICLRRAVELLQLRAPTIAAERIPVS